MPKCLAAPPCKLIPRDKVTATKKAEKTTITTTTTTTKTEKVNQETTTYFVPVMQTVTTTMGVQFPKDAYGVWIWTGQLERGFGTKVDIGPGEMATCCEYMLFPCAADRSCFYWYSKRVRVPNNELYRMKRVAFLSWGGCVRIYSLPPFHLFYLFSTILH